MMLFALRGAFQHQILSRTDRDEIPVEELDNEYLNPQGRRAIRTE
jgi:hypothetical protein